MQPRQNSLEALDGVFHQSGLEQFFTAEGVGEGLKHGIRWNRLVFAVL
jgi:hypothetical protein